MTQLGLFGGIPERERVLDGSECPACLEPDAACHCDDCEDDPREEERCFA